MKAVFSKYLTARVPRYTSYPTAPSFSPNFKAEDYHGWLRGLEPEASLSLYLHIPFCRRMCWYCGCNMRLIARYEPVEAYVRNLLSEIGMVAGVLEGRRRVTHIHWGGGTPTVLRAADFAAIDRCLRGLFGIGPNTQIAVEIDPRTFTEESAAALAAIACNRASLGVQEFDPSVQEAINRVQPMETVARTVDLLRANGIADLNFDLMYGLPHQTPEMLERTVDMAASLRPDRIALFGYAHVPWMAKNQRMIDEAALPDVEARFEQAEAAAARLDHHGYHRIGIDHFALPEDELAVAAREHRLRRNFQGYTTDDAPALIGFGVSAISRLPFGYAQNIVGTTPYSQAIAQGRLPVAKGLAFRCDDELRAAVIERIMCDFAVDLDEMAKKYGVAPGHFSQDLARLAPLAEDGLVIVKGNKLDIPPQGRPAARVIASAFDAYLPRAQAERRHSIAV